ncbi:MAG: hypothetical protein JKY31_09575 [Rhodobacteraceae bacterium]|nr:hypothetical protein [Paracoccaceae bacterium]
MVIVVGSNDIVNPTAQDDPNARRCCSTLLLGMFHGKVHNLRFTNSALLSFPTK